MAISNQLERIISILDELNGEKTKGYNLNIEEAVYYISKKLQKFIDGAFGNLPVSILGSDDYDHETGKPTIDSPEENVFYLVPTGEDSDDMFEEWVYTNGKWEHFGAGGSVQVPQSDWGQTNTAAADYIKNKPTIPAAQIQSDWNQTNTSAKDYIKNKPTIPAAQVQADWTQTTTTSSSFILNKPAIKAGTGTSSILEAFASVANGNYSHAEGNGTQARGIASHAEGNSTTASGAQSHAEGSNTTASEAQSHAEGNGTTASAPYSHAEGGGTTASGQSSHVEGSGTTASGTQSHAEGGGTTASGAQSHAEGGGTTASGAQSHAEGNNTIANHTSQHVFGEYNIADSSAAAAYKRGDYVEIVGNGTAVNTRSNARTLDWSGNEWLAGNLTAAGGSITIGSTTITEAQLQALLASLS